MGKLQIYNELLLKADELLKKHNPCKWNMKEKDCSRKTQGCCGTCPNLSLETGCRIQSLACKLWICPEISRGMPETILNEFRRLWNVAQENNLLTFRGGRYESVRNAKFPNANCRKYVMVNMYGAQTHIFSI